MAGTGVSVQCVGVYNCWRRLQVFQPVVRVLLVVGECTAGGRWDFILELDTFTIIENDNNYIACNYKPIMTTFSMELIQ